MKQAKDGFIRILALCLIISLIVPVAANGAVVEPALPMTSLYIDECTSTISAVGFGRLQINFNVTGTDIMDEIGVRSIEVYESADNVNWTYKQTYSHETYFAMMAQDTLRCGSNVSYQGIPGRYYKAYVCFWAEKNGLEDTRYIWTDVKRAA